jgi:hypothetical protein
VQARGASSGALDEIRRMAREIFGEDTTAAWDGADADDEDEDA